VHGIHHDPSQRASVSETVVMTDFIHPPRAAPEFGTACGAVSSGPFTSKTARIFTRRGAGGYQAGVLAGLRDTIASRLRCQ